MIYPTHDTPMPNNTCDKFDNLSPVSTPINFRAPEFIKSVAELNACPEDSGAEVAFAGRSNSGKSSTLNALTGHSRLAHTGKAPGRTRLINFFSLGDKRYRIVDLPGYGYAEVSKQQRENWTRLNERFIHVRHSLRAIFLVSDARHPLRDSDWYFINLAVDAKVPVCVLLNRADQLGREGRAKSLRRTQAECIEFGSEFFSDVQLFSATKNIGVEEVRARIITLMSP